MNHVAWEDGATGILAAGGKALEYLCLGPGPEQACTIVMLHEGLGSIAQWRGFPEALVERTGLGVLAYSRAGYGRSEATELPRPLDYLTREALDVLPGVLDTAGVRRVVLLGHSDGATIAVIHAGSRDDPRVLGLVLMAPHFFVEPVALAEIAKAKAAYESGDLRARLEKYHRDPDTAFRGWCDTWLNPDFRVWNVTGVLDDLRVPVLAMQGDADQYATLEQVRVIERRSPAPVELRVLPGCRHIPHLEQPEPTLAAISGFVQGLEGSKG